MNSIEQLELRNETQNARLHAAIRDISRQLNWAGQSWDEKDWKILIMASKYGQTVGPNVFGHGLVIMNNRRSSKLKKTEMSELLSEVMAFGDANNVRFTDPESVSLLGAYG